MLNRWWWYLKQQLLTGRMLEEWVLKYTILLVWEGGNYWLFCPGEGTGGRHDLVLTVIALLEQATKATGPQSTSLQFVRIEEQLSIVRRTRTSMLHRAQQSKMRDDLERKTVWLSIYIIWENNKSSNKRCVELQFVSRNWIYYYLQSVEAFL